MWHLLTMIPVLYFFTFQRSSTQTERSLDYLITCFGNTLVNITGCPSVLRMDKGTENVKVAATQYAFREGQNDAFAGNGSIRFGTSPANIVHATSL